MMKKFIFILLAVLLFTAFESGAQNSAVDRTIGYSDTYLIFDGGATDTIGLTDSTWTYTVRKKNDSKIFSHIYVALDSISGTANDVVITIENKAFPEESYSTLETVTWKVTSSDTTFSVAHSTAKIGEYWRVNVTGQADEFKAEIEDVNFKFVK